MGSHGSPTDTKYVLLDDREGSSRACRTPQSGASEREQQPLVSTVLRERQGTAELTGLDGVPTIYGFAPVGGKPGAACSSAPDAPPRAYSRTRTTTCAATSCSPGWASLRRLRSATLMTTLLLGCWSSAVVELGPPLVWLNSQPAPGVPTGLVVDRRGECARTPLLLYRAASGGADAAHVRARGCRGGDAQAESRCGILRRRCPGGGGGRPDDGRAGGGARGPGEREACSRHALLDLPEANRRLCCFSSSRGPSCASTEPGPGPALELSLTRSSSADHGFDRRVADRLDDEPAPRSAPTAIGWRSRP